MDLSGRQMEAQGFKDKADFYRKEYLRLSQMNSFDNVDSGSFSGAIGRA